MARTLRRAPGQGLNHLRYFYDGAELTFDEAWQTPGGVVAVGGCEEAVAVVPRKSVTSADSLASRGW